MKLDIETEAGGLPKVGGHSEIYSESLVSSTCSMRVCLKKKRRSKNYFNVLLVNDLTKEKFVVVSYKDP